MDWTIRSLAPVVVALVLTCFTAGGAMAVEESGGIGLKVSPLYDYTTKEDNKQGSIVILNVFKGSPAHRNGIQKGDVILKINDQVTRGNDFYDLLHNQLRGPANTKVTLELWRPSTRQQFEIAIERRPIVY